MSATERLVVAYMLYVGKSLSWLEITDLPVDVIQLNVAVGNMMRRGEMVGLEGFQGTVYCVTPEGLRAFNLPEGTGV